MRNYVIYSLFCTVMCVARGLSEIPTDTNDNQIISNNCPIKNQESRSKYQSRQLLDYSPIDQFGNNPLPGSEVAQLSNEYENPKRPQMTARRRAANNLQNYYNQENVAPNYNNLQYPMSPNSRPLIKRWGLFPPATSNSPLNNSSTTIDKKNPTPELSRENLDKQNSNSSTASPIYPTPPEYPVIIKNRQVPVWQVPDDSLSLGNSINDQSSLYNAYDDGNYNPGNQEKFNSPSNPLDSLKNNKISGSLAEPDKVKRGFRLVPVSRDLYLLREDNEPTPVDTNKQIPGLNNQRMINPKRSSLDLDDERKERTSAMLAFRAHMHHNVRDIGKSFLQRVTKKDQLSSSSDFIAGNQDLAYSPVDQNLNYNLYDPSIEYSPGSRSALQDNYNQIYLPQQQLEYSDPILNSIGDDINFDNQIGSETGAIESSKLDENNYYKSADVPNYQSDTINPQGLYPVVEDDYYSRQLNQFSSADKLNSLEKIEDSGPGESNELLERERGTREDSGGSNDFNLAYLDKYAKAVDDLNENWDLNREVESLGGDLVNPETKINSEGEKNIDGKVQKAEEETSVNSGEPGKRVDYEKFNGTSLAMVIEPLTEQLQKLLSSIKQVNEKLMNDSKNSEDTILLDSLRKKRGVSRSEADDFDGEDDDFDDEEFDDDVDEEEEDSRPERSDDLAVEKESSIDDKSQEKLFVSHSSSEPPLNATKINKKITTKPSARFQGNSSTNTSKKSSSLVNENLNNEQKKRNNGIVSFFQKTLGIGTTTMTPQNVVNITWNSETMSTDSPETTTTLELHQQFIDSDYSQTSGSTKFEKTTVTNLPDTPAATNLIDDEMTMPIEIAENNNPTTLKFSTDSRVDVPGSTKSLPEITEKIFNEETTMENNLFNNFQAVTTVVPQVRKNSSPGSEFAAYDKPSQKAHGQFSTISSTTSGAEIETIKVAMMPVDDFSNKKSSYLNQLLRTNSTEILARLLPPEIIQNITSDGIIVKIPFSRNVKNNSIVKNEVNNSGRLLINPGGGGADKIKGTRDEDAVVAVGDDDEDDSDTRLTIKLRLPNRSHSVSRGKIDRRNVDKKSAERVQEKSNDLIDGKSLKKRSEPVYEELDEDSFEDSEDYDEDSLTNEEHETEKRDANEFDESSEEQDDEEESSNNSNEKFIDSHHNIRSKKNQHTDKNQLKRADNIQNNSSNLPKFILRLRFPESPGEFSNSPESLSSSGLQREARNFALKKKSNKIELKRESNVRIGRSLKSIDEEIEEEDENFFLNEGNSDESEGQLRVVRDAEDTENNSEDIVLSTTAKIPSLPGTQETISTTVEKKIENISSSSVSESLTTKALEKVEEKEAKVEDDDSTNVINSTTISSSSLRNGTTEAEEEREEATSSTVSTTVTDSTTLTDITTNNKIIHTSTATNSNKIETTTLKKIESTVKSSSSTTKSPPPVLITVEDPESLTTRMEISSSEELKSTSMSVELNSKIMTREPLTLVATVTAPTTLKNAEENQQEKIETTVENLNKETSEMLGGDEKTLENFSTTTEGFLTSSSETGESGSLETSGDMTTTSLEVSESSESKFSTSTTEKLEELSTEKIEELTTEKIGEFTTEKIEELSVEKNNFPTTTQLYVPSIALTTVGQSKILNSENYETVTTDSTEKIIDSTIFSSSTTSMGLSTEELSTSREDTSLEENSTEKNLQTKNTTVEITSSSVSSSEDESTVSSSSEFFPTEIKSTTIEKITSSSPSTILETSSIFSTEGDADRSEKTQSTLQTQSTESGKIISSEIFTTKEEVSSSLVETSEGVSTIQATSGFLSTSKSLTEFLTSTTGFSSTRESQSTIEEKKVQEETATEGKVTEKVSGSLMIESTTTESSTSSLASSSSSVESSTAPPTESLTITTSQITPTTKSTTTEIISSSSELDKTTLTSTKADKTDESTTENYLSTSPKLETTEIVSSVTENLITSSEKIDTSVEISTGINLEMSTNEIEVASTEKIVPELTSTEKENLTDEIESGKLSTTSGFTESTETTEKKFSESSGELLSSLSESTSESGSSSVGQESTSQTESSTILITTEKIIPTSTTARVVEITTPQLFGIISQSKETLTSVQEGKTSEIVGETESSSSGISRGTESSMKIESSSEMGIGNSSEMEIESSSETEIKNSSEAEIESSSKMEIENSSLEVTSEKMSSEMTDFLSTENKIILENTTEKDEIKIESTTENEIIGNISTSTAGIESTSGIFLSEMTGTLNEETSTMTDNLSSSVSISSPETSEETSKIETTTFSGIPQVTESKSVTPETIISTTESLFSIESPTSTETSRKTEIQSSSLQEISSTITTEITGSIGTLLTTNMSTEGIEIGENISTSVGVEVDTEEKNNQTEINSTSSLSSGMTEVLDFTERTESTGRVEESTMSVRENTSTIELTMSEINSTEATKVGTTGSQTHEASTQTEEIEETSVKISETTGIMKSSEGILTTSTLNNQNNFSESTEESGSSTGSGSSVEIIETSTVETTEQSTTLEINETTLEINKTTYLSQESSASPENKTIVGTTESLAPEEATRSTLSEVSSTFQPENETESTESLSSESNTPTISSSTTEMEKLVTEISTQGLEVEKNNFTTTEIIELPTEGSSTNKENVPTTTELFIPLFSLTTKKFIESTLSEIPTTVFNFLSSTRTTETEIASTSVTEKTTLVTEKSGIASTSETDETTSVSEKSSEISGTELPTTSSVSTTLKIQSTTEEDIIEEPEVSTEAEGEEIDYETEVWTEENQTSDEENEEGEFEYEEENGGSTVKGQEFIDYKEDTTETQENISSSPKKIIATDSPGLSSSEKSPKSTEITEPFSELIRSTEESTVEISGGSSEPGFSSTTPGTISVSETTELGSSSTVKLTETTEKKLQSEIESTTLGLLSQNFTTDGSSVGDETTLKSLVVEVGKESETEGTLGSSGGISGSSQTEKLSTELSTIIGRTSETSQSEETSTKLISTSGEFNNTATNEETNLNTTIGTSEGGLIETMSTGETTSTSSTRETSENFISTSLEVENNGTESTILSTNEFNFENISSSSLGMLEEEITVSTVSEKVSGQSTVSEKVSDQSTDLNSKEMSSSSEVESTESLEKLSSTYESIPSVSEEKFDFSSTISSTFPSVVEKITTENFISLTDEQQVIEKTTSSTKVTEEITEKSPEILETESPTTISVSTTLKTQSTTEEDVIEEPEVSTEAEGEEIDYETEVWTEENQTSDEENEEGEFEYEEENGGSTVKGQEFIDYKEDTTESQEKISTTNISTEKIDTSFPSSSTKASIEFSSPDEFSSLEEFTSQLLLSPVESTSENIFTSQLPLSPVESTSENIFKTTLQILPTTNILETSEFVSTSSVSSPSSDLVGATLSPLAISSSPAAEILSTELKDLTSAFPWETTKTEKLTSVLAEFESNTDTLSNIIATPKPPEVIETPEAVLIESTTSPRSTIEATVFSSSLKPGTNEIQVVTTIPVKDEFFSTSSDIELSDVNKITLENSDGVAATLSGDLRPAQELSDELGIILITTENSPKILQNQPTTEFLFLTSSKSPSTTPEQVIEIPVVQTESGTPTVDFVNEILTEKIDLKENEGDKVTKVGGNVEIENPSSTETIDIIVNPEEKIEDNLFTTKKLSNDEIKTSTESSGTSILAILSKGTIISSPPETSRVLNNLESTSVSSSTVINGLTDGLTKLTSLLPWVTSSKPKISSSSLTTIENKNRNKPEYDSTKSTISDKSNGNEDVLSYVNDKQEKKRLRLLGRLRELERKEGELIEREKDLERRREKWEREKDREREKILKEEKNKKLTNNNKGLGRIDDDRRVEILKKLEENQEKLDDELERLVIKIEKKERDLEEKERILEENERKHEREREEFERQWSERNENDDDDDNDGRRFGKIPEEDDENSDRNEEYETTKEIKKGCNKKKPLDDYQWERKKSRLNSRINGETATKTICLDVVDENSQNGFKNNDYVTRVVCLPRGNHPHSRKERKLLNLEYDDNEENKKLNCEEQDEINQELTTNTIDTMKKNFRNLKTGMGFKFSSDSEGDGNSGGNKLEQDEEKIYDNSERDGAKTPAEKNPLGAKWPIELTTKFHIRTIKNWDKKQSSTTNKISTRKLRAEREIKNDYSADDYEDSDGEIGTTCFTMIIKNRKKNKNKKSSKCVPKRELNAQVEKPEFEEDESEARWVNFKPNLRTIKSLGQSGDNFVENVDNNESVKEKWPLYIKINNKEIIEINDFEILPKEFPNSCKHNPQETFALYDFPGDDNQQLTLNPSEDDRERHNRWLWNKKKKKKRKKKKKHKSWIGSLHRHLLSLDDKIEKNQFPKNSTSVNNSFLNSMDFDDNKKKIGRSLLSLRSLKKKIRSNKSKLSERKKLNKSVKKLKLKKKDRRVAKREVDHVDGKKKKKSPGPGKTKDLMGKVMKIIKPMEKKKLIKKASKKTTRSIIDKMKKVINDVIGPEDTTTVKIPINLSIPESDDDDDVEDYTEIIHHSAQLYEPKHGKRRPIDGEISGLSRLEDYEADRAHQRHLGYHLKGSKNEGEDHHSDFYSHEKSRHDRKFKNDNFFDRNDRHHHENRKKLSVAKDHPRSLELGKKNAQHFDGKKNKIIKVSGAKRNVLVQNNSKQFNISSIITRVKNLIEGQNLGSVEKIVVYVDKNNPVAGRKKKKRQEVVVEKKKKKEINIPVTGKIKKFQVLNDDEMYFDGDSLDQMISHVADKILKSVFDSQRTREILDPRLSIKVIQEISNGTELPHEETKTEFMIDLSQQGLPIDKMNLKKNLFPLKSKKELHKNSARLTGKLTERKMNLPVIKKKKKRSNWRKKIKRENIAVEIRNKLVDKLNEKLRSFVGNYGNWRLDKTKRKIAGDSLGDFDVPLSHHVDDLDEKIRIMYALHQKKENKLPINSKKKRNHQIVNHPRPKREGNLEFNNLDSKIFANENDKKSLRALIDQILNLQKNVNTTLEIIRKRINKDPPRNSTNLLTRKEKSSREFEKYLRPLKVEIRSSVKNKKLKGKSEKNDKQKKKNKKKEGGKNKKKKLEKKLKVKESKHPRKQSKDSKKKKLNNVKNKKSLSSKKKKEQKSNAEERLDKMSRDIKSFLQREHERDPKKFDGSLSRINSRFKRRSLQALQYDDEPTDTDYPTNPIIGRHLCSKTPKLKSEKKKNKQKNFDKKLNSKKSLDKKLKSSSSKKIKNKNSKKDKSKKINKSKNTLSSFHKNSGLKNVTLNKIRIKKKAQQASSLICDMDNVLLNLKKLLIHKNDLLDKISTYSCDKFIEIGDEIILSSSGVLGDILPRSRRELAEAKGLKYIKPGQLEDVLRQEQVLDHEHEVLSFPGSDLHVPCSHEGEEITWLMSLSRPNYTWVRLDGQPVSGTIRKNGNLELYDVDTKDTGNYSCIVSYLDPDNEEFIENNYIHKIKIVTLPRYLLRGGNRYKLDEECDEIQLDALSSYLPTKLNEILCQNDICDVFIFAPHCSRHEVSIKIMITPSSTSAFFPLGTSQCGLRCRKAVQDKIVLLLSRNLRQVLQKTIAFRLPHRGQSRLVPVGGRNNNNNNNYGKRRREERETRGDAADGDVGLLVGCPAGYGLQNSHCSPCQAGHHSQDLSSRCKKCAPGTYQPGLGARICRVCTNPFVEDCYDTIWNYSPILAGAVLVMVIVGLIFYHKFCCRERQKTQDNSDQDETRCPLITHNQTQDHFDDDDDDEVIWEKNKKKKRKFFKKFIKTNDNSMQPYIFGIDMVPKRKSEVQRCDKVKTIPVCCIDSYRSHGEHCRECKHPQHRAYISQHCSRKNSRPPVPFPDFDR